MRKHKYRKINATSLIELIAVLVILSILSVGTASFISFSIKIYSRMVTRSGLVDMADAAIRQMQYDLGNAVPNSVRVKTSGNLVAIELMHAAKAYQYRINPPGSTSLNAMAPSTGFNVLSPFSAAILASGPYRLVINNTGDEIGGNSDQPVNGRNVYGSAVSPNVITPASGTTVTLSNNGLGTEGQIAINSAFLFNGDSPQDRVYLVDTPISYICNTSSGNTNLTRYWGYTTQAVQPTSISGSSNALAALNITGCKFSYQQGTAERFGVVTIALTITDPISSEQITLLEQVNIINAA